jgi:hypothetical protein
MSQGYATSDSSFTAATHAKNFPSRHQRDLLLSTGALADPQSNSSVTVVGFARHTCVPQRPAKHSKEARLLVGRITRFSVTSYTHTFHALRIIRFIAIVHLAEMTV